ncbi:MAG: hypothetical protein NVS2B17_26110 [Candidatus Velthaea sp.]
MRLNLTSLLAAAAMLPGFSACGGGANVSPPTASRTSSTSNVQTASSALPLQAQSLSREFNAPGNILIADQFNNRVIEVDSESHRVVWSFGGSPVAGPGTIVGKNDAQRIGRLTFMAGTGVPPANPPLEPTCANGCVDNRVILVNPQGNIVWQYGHAGVAGSGPN